MGIPRCQLLCYWIRNRSKSAAHPALHSQACWRKTPKITNFWEKRNKIWGSPEEILAEDAIPILSIEGQGEWVIWWLLQHPPNFILIYFKKEIHFQVMFYLHLIPREGQKHSMLFRQHEGQPFYCCYQKVATGGSSVNVWLESEINIYNTLPS